MLVHITGISVDFRSGDKIALEKARAELGLSGSQEGFVVRKAVDARRKPPKFVYTIGFELENVKGIKTAENIKIIDQSEQKQSHGTHRLSARPVIVGFGPAGMMAAITLAKAGYRPIVLERGGDVDYRVDSVNRLFKDGIFDVDSNIQFGEGGAGTFSDGKLTTRIGDSLCNVVLRHFVDMGADREILYLAKPHIGTDKLRGLVQKTREEIIRLGGEIKFFTRFEDFRSLTDGTLLLKTNSGELVAGVLILAIGHSARDTLKNLCGKLTMKAKQFSVGFRIEHLQSEVDLHMYGSFAGDLRLPKAEYQLWHRQGDRGVYTFCMCPGGVVVPATSEENGVVTNGMSYHSRAGKNANSAIVVNVDEKDFGSGVLDGIAFQRSIEQKCFVGGYRAPVSTLGEFLGKSTPFGRVLPSYVPGVCEQSLKEIYPNELTKRLQQGIEYIGSRAKFFSSPDAVLTAPETRTSSPVRILRLEDTLTSPDCDRVYPCGEGAGYAGGIMSAAVDGIKIAQRIISRYSAE